MQCWVGVEVGMSSRVQSQNLLYCMKIMLDAPINGELNLSP
jgi:hypothetical protein